MATADLRLAAPAEPSAAPTEEKQRTRQPQVRFSAEDYT